MINLQFTLSIEQQCNRARSNRRFFMSSVHQFALYLHIAAGVAALLLFWIPVFSKKGSLNHRQFGRYFAMIMYTVAFSGLIMALLDLWNPLGMHQPRSDAAPEALAAMADGVRFTALFLLSLSILVLTTTRHGWLTILHREDRTVLRHPVHVLLCLSLALVGLILLVTGVSNNSLLMIVFGTLEIWLATGFMHYAFKAELSHPREWWTEHLGGLIASGIGAYTAFFVVGAASLLDTYLQGSMAGLMIFFWIAPGIIGGIAIGFMTRHYRVKFRKQGTA